MPLTFSSVLGLLAVAGDEDLADAAIKLLNLNLTPGMETYDDSNFEVRA